MKRLTERTKDLLLMGANTMGDFTNGLCFIEERIYIHEHPKGLYEFCQFIDNEIGGAGSSNIDLFWLAFNNPNDKDIQSQFEVAKKRVEELRKYL